MNLNSFPTAINWSLTPTRPESRDNPADCAASKYRRAVLRSAPRNAVAADLHVVDTDVEIKRATRRPPGEDTQGGPATGRTTVLMVPAEAEGFEPYLRH